MPIVCGIHPVLEALAAGSRTIERVVVTKGVRNKRILEVIKKASERGVPLRFEPREALDRAADGERHQGVLAIVAEKGLLTLEDLQKSARTPALFMLLDGVEDPRNLGAIIRSVDAAGADGVILPDRHTASLSDAASRTAAGALESVKIARIGNVVQALETLKSKGFWIVGFDGSGKERWDAIDYKRPIVLVLGGEGKGIRRLVKEHCDHVVSLPVFGQVSSLNVSVAAGIALYEAVRQRGTVPTLARPIPPRALAAKKPVVIGPPPEDREEDPGARRRAAAIASIVSAAESARLVKPEAVAPVVTASEPSTARPEGSVVDEPESTVPEASVEPIRPDEDADDESRAARAARAADVDEDEDDAGDDDADGSDDDDSDDDGADDDDGDDDDRDDDDDEEEGDDDSDDEDGDEDDSDDDGDEEGDDDRDDDGDDADDDEEEDDEDDEHEDPGDEASDLATPFMPEDNSGGGEVTWGSEKELHAHRPRREGERRFGNNGGRRSGRPQDRKKRPKPQGGAAAPSGGGRPSGQGQQNQGQPNQGQPGQPQQNRDQGRNQGGRDQNRNQQNRNQQRRGPDRNREPRPPQEGGQGGAPNDAENPRPQNGPGPEGGSSPENGQQNGGGERRPDQPREQNRPGQGRNRNRRRRGGRGRTNGQGRPPADPNAPQG
ncbi:MAG: 23S rRNA (guanosine(2251)-2'-O)-methyltransferase RlmB, partial [Vicinamibacteria bacterium]|nr:23S rRNA (guanosine(2251)-2'-O)-methyltransferase RlmB [Vicinamibacteria bacterium]